MTELPFKTMAKAHLHLHIDLPKNVTYTLLPLLLNKVKNSLIDFLTDEEKNYWIADILSAYLSGQDVRDPEKSIGLTNHLWLFQHKMSFSEIFRNIFHKIFIKYLQASSCHEYSILVMHQGRITGQLDREEATQERIMRFATNQERRKKYDRKRMCKRCIES